MQEKSLSCIAIVKDAFAAVSRGFGWLVKTFWVVVLVYWVSSLILPPLNVPAPGWRFISLLLDWFAALASLKIAEDLLEETSDSIGGILSFAFRKYLWMVLFVIVLWLVMFVLTLIVVFAGGIVGGIARLIPVAGPILVALVFIGAVLIEMYVVFRLFGLALFAFLLNERGLVESFKESWRITGEHFWTYLCIVILLLILGIVGGVLVVGVSFIFYPLGPLYGVLQKLVFSLFAGGIGLVGMTSVYLFYRRSLGEEDAPEERPQVIEDTDE